LRQILKEMLVAQRQQGCRAGSGRAFAAPKLSTLRVAGNRLVKAKVAAPIEQPALVDEQGFARKQVRYQSTARSITNVFNSMYWHLKSSARANV